MKPISVLVSEPNHYWITQINPELSILQKLVGGYIEPVTDPHWTLYCNEEGKLQGLPVNATSTRLVDELFVDGGMWKFSNYDVLVGSILWCGPVNRNGGDTSLPLNLVRQYAQVEHTRAREVANGQTRITMIRRGNDVWLRDDEEPIHVETRVREARQEQTHITVDVWTGIDPQNLSAVLPTDGVTVHDERIHG